MGPSASKHTNRLAKFSNQSSLSHHTWHDSHDVGQILMQVRYDRILFRNVGQL